MRYYLGKSSWGSGVCQTDTTRALPGGSVFLFIPSDCQLRKITQVEYGGKLTSSHNFAVKASRVKSYGKPTQNVFVESLNGKFTFVEQAA